MMCRATNKSSGIQVTQRSSSGTQLTQHAKLGTPSGSDMACHISIRFADPALDGFAWTDKV
jgi:hypothetical protein